MPTKPASNLRFEASDDIGSLADKAMDVFVDDVLQKNLPVPHPHPVAFLRVAKTRDGAVVGGIVGTSQWNYLEITHLAVHHDFRDRGVGTALMKCAEQAARGELVCNQIHLSVLSWQPRPFFEKVGYTLQWTRENHPRGHTTHHMVKEWPLGWRDEAVQGYDGAAKDVVIVEGEDVEQLSAQLTEWLRVDAARLGVTNVPPCTRTTYGLAVRHPDGSLAAVCIYDIYWNMLYVHILTVMKGGKRRGVGSAVLQKMKEIARERDCDYVSLYTMSWQARPFYEKNGFTVAATQKDLPFTFHRYALCHAVAKLPQSKL